MRNDYRVSAKITVAKLHPGRKRQLDER